MAARTAGAKVAAALAIAAVAWSGTTSVALAQPARAAKDAGKKNAGVKDAGAKDGAKKDAGAKSAGTKDAGAKDAGAKSAGAKDAGAKSAGAKDAGAKSAGAKDLGKKDAGKGSPGAKDAGKKAAGDDADRAVMSSAPPEPAEPVAAAAPAELAFGGQRPLLLEKGKLLVAGSTLNVNLTSGDILQPLSLAPSVWYGVNQKLELGLTHDGGTTPWTPRPAIIPGLIDAMGNAHASGGGICFVGARNGCKRVYDNVGVDGLYMVKQKAKLDLAAHPALEASSFSPFGLRLRLGVLGRYRLHPRLSVVFDPRLSFGLSARDSGNIERIDLPAWGWLAVNAKLGVYLHTAIAGQLDGFFNVVTIPVQVGASYRLDAKLTVGGDFSFMNLIGAAGGVSERALGLRVAYER